MIEPPTKSAKKKYSIMLSSTKPKITGLNALRKRMFMRLSKKNLRKD
jgi:hypothetical protein